MSNTVVSADELLEKRGVSGTFDAFVTGACFDRAGTHFAASLGDGRVVVRDIAAAAWNEHSMHDGAILSMAPDSDATGVLTGGDDGHLRRIDTATGATSSIATYGMKWVEHVASFADRKAPIRAAAVGRNVLLLDGKGGLIRTLTHPSTVSGIAFDAKGRRIAASHYNGASLWFVRSENAKPQVLEWKGSHIGVALHPGLDAIVTAMQENALHGWKLPDGAHMRMSGYPAKPESLGFTRSGRWLASAGAEAVILWPFFGGGPMGKEPLELGAGETIVKRIACHPQTEVVAAGYADGSVVVVDIARERVLPIAAAGRGAISALAWSPDGALLGFGSETGFLALVDFSRNT
ncbi:MAG: WD40 repeat domain-containing protein [Acidiphilium sp.]|nr:WD40 repeat domain-containing protein [Acidiphilium sp.]MDD4935660.1 WD40 repeat domain-containing protein [Acidiphilium sp.]